MLSRPERTRRTEPCWGKASAYSRAIRLPAGRRRGNRAPSGRTVSSNSAPRYRGDSATFVRSALRTGGFSSGTVMGTLHRGGAFDHPLHSLLFSASLKARSPVRFSIAQQACGLIRCSPGRGRCQRAPRTAPRQRPGPKQAAFRHG